MNVKDAPARGQNDPAEFTAFDTDRAQALASFERARRNALPATGSLKRLPDRVAAAIRAGPSSLADVLAGTIGTVPDPLPEMLFAAAQKALAGQGLSSPPRGGKRKPAAQTIRDSLISLAALPSWFPMSNWPVPMIERATILIYEWSEELKRAEGRENSKLPRDHHPTVEEARAAGAALLQEDEEFAAARADLTANARARVLAKRHKKTADAIRGQLRRARSLRRHRR